MGIEDHPGRVGPWATFRVLGSGGNAVVWAAQRDDAEGTVALKVVKSQRAEREPYQRFVQEIQFLRSLTDTQGILALIDAYLPDTPSRAEPAWLAMPLARPITEALGDAPLPRVVEAVAAIAATLARLAAEGAAHRDIKPSNLYERDGQWLVGDFGLVAYPDAAELTQENRPLGPLRFQAYEMVQNPATADPFPADVYSLGKTLWVLATGQRYPPEGHQPANTRIWSIADQNPGPRSAALDRLVDRMTRLHPEQRPSMAEVAQDLEMWRALVVEVAPFDVGALRAKILEKQRVQLEQEDLQAQRKELAYDTVKEFQRLVAPLSDALRAIDRSAMIDQMPDTMVHNALRTASALGRESPIFTWQRSSSIRGGRPHVPLVLKAGRAIELFPSGELLAHAIVFVGYEGLAGNEFWWRPQPSVAPVGSIQASRMIEELANELREQLDKALAVYAQELPEST